MAIFDYFFNQICSRAKVRYQHNRAKRQMISVKVFNGNRCGFTQSLIVQLVELFVELMMHYQRVRQWCLLIVRLS